MEKSHQCALVIVRVQSDETPLYLAATKGHSMCVRLLIDSGANVNFADKVPDLSLITAIVN